MDVLRLLAAAAAAATLGDAQPRPEPPGPPPAAPGVAPARAIRPPPKDGPTPEQRKAYADRPEFAEKRREVRQGFDTRLRIAQEALNAGDFRKAYMYLRNSIEFPFFDWLEPAQQYQAAGLMARIATSMEDWDQANQAAGLAVRTLAVTRDDWRLRLFTAIRANAPDDAFEALQVLAKTSPDFVEKMDDDDIVRLDELLLAMDGGYEARFELEDYLEKNAWRPPTGDYRGEVMRLHYVTGLLQRGRTAEARKLAALIHQPSMLAAMRADKRFDAVAPKAGFDAMASADADLAEARQTAAQHAYSMAAQHGLAVALHRRNRSQEALAVLDRILAKAAISDADAGIGYTDAPWGIDLVLQWRSSLMVYTGKVELGVSSMVERAARTGPDGDYSGPMSLGIVLNSLGRAAEARPYIAGVNERSLSLRGRMKLAALKACAAGQLGDQAEVAVQLAWLGENMHSAPDELLAALVCNDRADDAAALIKRLLADPNTRSVALFGLQRFARKAVEPSQSRRINDAWDALRARPDIQAAVAPLGRIETYDLQNMESVS
jgi:beta-barrel assembly-enhancing protease